MKVTFDVFSGMPNPSWTLSEKNTKKIIERFAGKALPAPSSIDSILGFRGYIIEAVSDDTARKAGLPDAFRVGSIMPEEFIAVKDMALPLLTPKESIDAAMWLLTTAEEEVDEELLSYAEGVIKAKGKGWSQQKEKPVRSVREKIERAPCVICNTPYNPSFWNTPLVQPYNNCYNYSMNYRSDTFAQPGRISGHPNSVMQCSNVATAANWDGCRAVCSGRNKNVALVIWPGRDYHWYRKHSNGFWGHKPGGTAARNTDNRGRVIGGALNPQNCDRGPYTIFCGYRYSPTGMKVR